MADVLGSGPGFSSVEEVRARLSGHGYLPDDAIATTVFLAARLGKPVLVEGPAGVGKTELAKAVAAVTGLELVRLQCYEGLDEARALYEWNYRKQLLRIQAESSIHATGPVTPPRPSTDEPGSLAWRALHDDIFGEEFLLERPLLHAVRSSQPVVLLIDEMDKADVEVEGLLLEVLSDFQVTIPELGTIVAKHRPFVVLTSNATRDLSEALRRRCLHLRVGYPEAQREKAIVLSRVPEASAELTEQIVRTVRALRAMDLRKPPSISETIDWARTLLALGIRELNGAALTATVGVVLKHSQDAERALGTLARGGSGAA